MQVFQLALTSIPDQNVVCVSITTPTIIQGAKEDSDAFLTGLINQELAQKSDSRVDDQDKAQCPRGEPKGAAAAGQSGGQRDTGESEPMDVEMCVSSGGTTSPMQKGVPVVSEVWWPYTCFSLYCVPSWPWPPCKEIAWATFVQSKSLNPADSAASAAAAAADRCTTAHATATVISPFPSVRKPAYPPQQIKNTGTLIPIS